MDIKQKKNKEMELIEKIEHVSFDKENSDEEHLYIDFVIDGLPYYLKMLKWDGLWEVNGVSHFWEYGVECNICGKIIVDFGECEEINSGQELDKIADYLLKAPNVRLIALLNGVKL